MYLSSCTLTGVDEKTSLAELERLSKLFPQVEWGFLYSPKRQGTPGRYPSIAFLEHFFERLSEPVRIALHVCGEGVANLLRGNPIELHLLQHVAKRNGRIQLNFNQRHDPVDLDILAELLHGHPETTFITQHNDANGELIEELLCRGVVNHAVLFDSSGGQGVECKDWPKPALIPCGYAGGLGPDNIATEFCKIAAKVGERTIWIDMEGNLRRNDRDGVDWLDLCRCHTVLASVCCRPLRPISEREISEAPIANGRIIDSD